MDLLGTWPSKLATFHYEELLQLLKQAVSQGDYGAGQLFDQQAASDLITQAQDFSSLPVISAGDRAIADSLNYPLQLLQARYAAISKESQDFLTQMNSLLSVVEADSDLVEYLLIAAGLEQWVNIQPLFSGAQRKSWDYAGSRGKVASGFSYQDPHTGLIFTSDVSKVTDASFNLEALGGQLATGQLQQGIGVPSTVATIAPTNLTWSFSQNGAVSANVENEVLYGPDWAKLTLLEDKVSLTYGSPVVSTISPQGNTQGTDWSNFFYITGTSTSGNLPVYLRVLFTPRRSNITLALTGQPQRITGNRLITDGLIVYNQTQSFQLGVDYLIDNNGNIVAMGSLINQTVSIMFSEGFPSYQCSIDQVNWSPLVMLDPLRPAPDGSTTFSPVPLQNNAQFPIMDETGTPLGLYLTLKNTPPTEYLLQIQSPIAGNYGAMATLEVDFDRPLYMNGLRIAPFSSYGLHLKSISADGMGTQTGLQLFSGDFVIDRPQTIRFPRQLINRLYLTFAQTNYTVKTHSIDPAQDLKMNALASLQAVLPFALQKIESVAPNNVSGFQYEFSIGTIQGEDWTPNTTYGTPGIFIAGPIRITGTPEIVRLDVDLFVRNDGDIRTYLMAQESSSDGTVSSIRSITMTPGQAFLYAPVKPASYVDFYLKFVMTDEFAVIKRYLLQATNV